MRVLLLLLWILAAPAAIARPLALTPYVGNFLLAEVEIGGRPARLLFDTGAGVTSITPAFARSVGCVPHGVMIGFRVNGERIAFQKCEGIGTNVGGAQTARDLAVLDLSSLLPREWPPIDGVMGLDVFDRGEVTLSLANRSIAFGSRRGGGWREGRMRLQREMAGAGVSAFVRAQAKIGTLWMLLDSGNMGPTLLSPGAIEQLDDGAQPTTLSVDGIGPRSVTAQTLESAIYDGNLGYAFLRDFDIAVDLGRSRIWWRSANENAARRR